MGTACEKNVNQQDRPEVAGNGSQIPSGPEAGQGNDVEVRGSTLKEIKQSALFLDRPTSTVVWMINSSDKKKRRRIISKSISPAYSSAAPVKPRCCEVFCRCYLTLTPDYTALLSLLQRAAKT